MYFLDGSKVLTVMKDNIESSVESSEGKMIYVTGDTHGEISRFYAARMDGESEWTNRDKLIICGDFGFVWHNPTNIFGYKRDQNMLDLLEAKPYDILFVDGNHENYELLYSYPIVTKYGNDVHKIRKNIFHLQRGRVYTIDGKTCFCFGGAYSIDKHMRRKGISWWEQELPTSDEYHLAIDSLRAMNHKVDYIITHTAPQTLIRMLGYFPHKADAELTGFLDWVWHEVEFKKWYFGHWHGDVSVADKARLLWFDVETIS